MSKRKFISLERSQAFVRWRIHLGAHKTGTTHFQSVLSHHQSCLGRQGIGVLLPKELRTSNCKTKLPKIYRAPWLSRLYAHQTRHYLGLIAGEFTSLIVSEENFIGSPTDILASYFYPNLDQRMKVFQQIFPYNKTIFLSIRNQADLLPSAYVQRLRHSPIPGGFQLLKYRWINTPPSWQDLIIRISKSITDSKLKIWTLEEYRDYSIDIVSAVCETQLPMQIKLPIPRNTKTPSWEAIQEIEQLGSKVCRKEYREQVLQIIDSDNGGTKFAPFSDSEYKTLSHTYQRDRDAISKMNEAVWLR